ncbi:unnamed protein product, partial [Callosobruchus maculatus]
TTGVPQ